MSQCILAVIVTDGETGPWGSPGRALFMDGKPIRFLSDTAG
jgi:hypothetical protein